jgi:predicted dienelactone hydrolase
MKTLRWLFSAAILAFTFIPYSHAQDLVKARRPDGAETPLRIYAPKSGMNNCTLLAVISPGAGGTENGYFYLGKGLSEHGWLAIVMGHKESGPAALAADMLKSGIHDGTLKMVTDHALERDRILDIGAALSWANMHCNHPYKVLLGHSMGSGTVMFEAGAKNKLDVQGQDRFDAYVAISPSGTGSIFPEGAWAGIRKPLYVLTGTNDKGLEGTWQWRASPYDNLPPGCKWLGVVDGATHINFAGMGFSEKTKELTLKSVNSFLDDARNGKCDAVPNYAGMSLKNK